MAIATNQFQCVLYAVRDHVATITLNRPERRNALNPRAYAEIEAAFHAASADDDVRVVIATGADPAFCSGGGGKEVMGGGGGPGGPPPGGAAPDAGRHGGARLRQAGDRRG